MTTVEQQHEWRRQHKEKGLCVNCSERATHGTSCKRHYEQLAKYRYKIKAIVYEHYGNSCKCCGEDNVLFLNVDHIRNDGKTHRMEIGSGSSNIYHYLINNKFPKGFQLLCSNCNGGKAHNGGVCPHKKIALASTNYGSMLYAKKKKIVFDHYGNECACCGESTPQFLVIDHVNGGGSKHRLKLPGNGLGAYIHIWLIKNNFPPGFQLLCWNCNEGKSRNHGICPHKS